MLDIIIAALLMWGMSINVNHHDVSDNPAYDNVTAYGWVIGPTCDVYTSKLFKTLSYQQQVGLMGHEIGHCLGLEHTDEESIMRDGTFWTQPTDQDIVNMRRMHPLQYRVVLPFVQ